MVWWLVVGVQVGLGLGALFWAYARRRDRPPGTTLWWIAAGGFVLLVPAAATGSEAVLLALMGVLVVLLPAAALVVEWRRSRDQRRGRQWALEAGMDPATARKNFRRAPRGAITIIATYYLVGLVWVFGVAGVLITIGATDAIERPSWRVPLGDGQSMESPWWMVVLLVFFTVGVIHMFVNMVRAA